MCKYIIRQLASRFTWKIAIEKVSVLGRAPACGLLTSAPELKISWRVSMKVCQSMLDEVMTKVW